MASRNLNFPQAYGTGIVLIPFSFFGLATGGGTGMDIINEQPTDNFSVEVTTTGFGAGAIAVTTVDKFSELVSCYFQCSGQPDRDFYYGGRTDNGAGNWSVILNQYKIVAGVRIAEYSNADFTGGFVVRNSGSKF